MFATHSKYLLARFLIFLLLGLVTTGAFAWERGLNAGSWTKGAALNVFVDPIPADAPAGTSEAVDEAMKEWNDAQAPFGGLKLVRAGATKDNADIHISWDKNTAGGATNQKDATDKNNNGFTKETVRMTVGYGLGTNSRGLTRVLKHEFGHTEGLGHSAKSDLMKEDAYTSNPGKPPTVADINSVAGFTPPTADDMAGKKTLWGTKEKLSISEVPSTVIFDGTNYIYDYSLHVLNLTGLADPVTEFTIDMLPGIGLSDFSVTGIPTGWHFVFFDGTVEAGGFFDDNELPSPSLLSFLADIDSFGIFPGKTADFQLTSSFGPGTTRAFTNSPNFDSDEFVKQAPARIPEPNTLLLLIIGALGMLAPRSFAMVASPNNWVATVTTGSSREQ